MKNKNYDFTLGLVGGEVGMELDGLFVKNFLHRSISSSVTKE